MNKQIIQIQRITFYLTLFSLIVGTLSLSAQLSVPGVPLSEQFTINNQIDTIVALLKTPEEMQTSSARLAVEREEGSFSIETPIIGESIIINRSISECGNWIKLPNGNLIWQAVFTSPGAGAVGVLFSKYNLPKGAEVYIYNENKTKISGAFTHLNNNKYDLLNTAPVDGETVIVELNLYNPKSFDIELEIGEIVHYYSNSKARAAERTPDEACFVSVNCSPEGDDWQEVKRGIAQMHFPYDSKRWGYCSGSLVNNTRQDGIPYFLSAFHCGGSTSAISKAKSLFFFDYELLGCTEGDTTQHDAKSLTGCEMIAFSEYDGGLDMLLLRINENPPEEWKLYWNGWDFTKYASTSGVGIHHPMPTMPNELPSVPKSIKRISTYVTPLVPMANMCTDFDDGKKCGLQNGYWAVQWAATGSEGETTEWRHSVTAPGSSGSPLFNSKKRLVGTLTAGASSCTSPNEGDFYSRFDLQWNYFSDPEKRLQPWLDPLNISKGTLDGYPSSINETLITNNNSLLSWRKTDGTSVFIWQGKDGVQAEAFSTTGALVGLKLFYNGENYWELPAGAVYLVRVEGEIIKVQP